jgi:hypothetical protein
MKRYDTEKNKYYYVMIAELNTVTPTFHLLLDPPEEARQTPYFDEDSTNVQYYLHMGPDYRNQIAVVPSDEPSDETITQGGINWSYSNNTEIATTVQPSQKRGDIYYNKAGFDPATRTHEETIKDSINYDLVASGRRYSNSFSDPVGLTNQKDMREWYIHLPSVGNAICELWDKVYGYDSASQKRYLNDAL